MAGIYGEAQKKVSTRLSAFYIHLCLLLLNSCSTVPSRNFFLGEAIYSLSNYSRKGSILFQCNQGDPHMVASYETLCAALSCSLPLSLTSFCKKWPFPFTAPWHFSPSIHISQIHILHLSRSLPSIVFFSTLSLQLCRLLILRSISLLFKRI